MVRRLLKAAPSDSCSPIYDRTTYGENRNRDPKLREEREAEIVGSDPNRGETRVGRDFVCGELLVGEAEKLIFESDMLSGD